MFSFESNFAWICAFCIEIVCFSFERDFQNEPRGPQPPFCFEPDTTSPTFFWKNEFKKNQLPKSGVLN